MSKLNIKGRVYYPPGPWGMLKPVPNAKITITDIDLPGRKHDKIFTATADNNGRFSGKTREWQDKVRVKYWKIDYSVFPPKGYWAYQQQPDMTDVMLLQVKIKADGKQITGPFPFAGNNIEIPLIVTWEPLLPWGTVNGVEFTDFQQLIDKFITTVEAKDPIELKLYGDWSDAIAPLIELIEKPPLELAQGIFPGSQAGSLIIALGGGITITVSALALGGLALLVVAIGGAISASVVSLGAAAFVTAMGVGIILAILSGYMDITASQTSTTDAQGATTNVSTISFNNTGC